MSEHKHNFVRSTKRNHQDWWVCTMGEGDCSEGGKAYKGCATDGWAHCKKHTPKKTVTKKVVKKPAKKATKATKAKRK